MPVLKAANPFTREIQNIFPCVPVPMTNAVSLSFGCSSDGLEASKGAVWLRVWMQSYLRSPPESQEHQFISRALSVDQDKWQLTGPQRRCDLKGSSAAAIFSCWAVVWICLRQIPLLHSDGLSGCLCEESGNSVVILQGSCFSVFKSFELWRERGNIIFLRYH